MWQDFEMVDGFHGIEKDDEGPFVWTTGKFRIRAHSGARFAKLRLCYYGSNGRLAVRDAYGTLVYEVKLEEGWQTTWARFEVAAGGELTFELSPVIPVATDTRELGIMLRTIEPFDEETIFETLVRAKENLKHNEEEFQRGVSRLESFPPQLRVSMEVRCNLPETSQACVYCAWDYAKGVEQGSPPFTYQTLDDLGEFYRCATEVVDCSIGEPTMKKDFAKIVQRMADEGKLISMTTNGQMLGPNRRQQLLGKKAIIYVSIDSATAKGYSRYRNDRFDDIVTNLKALCREKKAHDNLPHVFVTFLVMRSNIGELPEFLDLMKEIGVDEVKLRSLNLDSLESQATVVNNGYEFRYIDEVVTMAELRELDVVARRLAEERGVMLYNETEQFAADASTLADAHAEPTATAVATAATAGATVASSTVVAEAPSETAAEAPHAAPVCSEPWKTMYFLRRGIFPCCYGVDKLATWDQQGDRTLSQFLEDVFNNETMQSIRSELAQGRLADYCRNTPSCPILKRMVLEGRIDDVAPPPALATAREAGLPLVALDTLRSSIKPAIQAA